MSADTKYPPSKDKTKAVKAPQPEQTYWVRHPTLGKLSVAEWRALKPACHCLHDAHPLPRNAMPAAVCYDFDDQRREFMAEPGVHCSEACALGCVLGEDSFQQPTKLFYTRLWCQRFIAADADAQPSKPAPQRHELQLFGGALAIEQFRRAHLGAL